MAQIDFPVGSPDNSPWTGPNGVTYTWNTDGYWETQSSSGGGGSAQVGTLQQVTDLGNNTTNSITIDTDKIVLNADGSSYFAADATINGLTVGRGAGDDSSNTAVGRDALNSNTTGNEDTAVGSNALANNTEGNLNTAVGQAALRYNVTGSNNTAIGRNAGQFIEGSNNTILGAYQGTATDASLSDTVIISAGPTERMRIDNSGDVLIGGTLPASPNILLNANGTVSGLRFISDQTSNSGYNYLAQVNGSVNSRIDSGGVKIGGTLDNGSTASQAPNISLNTDGSGEFASYLMTGKYSDASGDGCFLGNKLTILKTTTDQSDAITVSSPTKADADAKVKIKADGSATFAGDITLANGSTINTTSSAATITIQGGASNPGGRIDLAGGSGGNNIRFFTNAGSTSTERMRITPNGDVFINHTSSVSPVVGGEKFGVVGDGNIAIAGTTTINTVPTLFISNTSDTTDTLLASFATGALGNTRGEIAWNGSQLIYGSTSDYRLKENIVGFSDGIEIIKQLRPVKYNWIENGNEDVGFLAHEVQAVFSNAVSGKKDAVDDNGKILPQSYDPSKLVPFLTAALQEAITRIETLEAEVQALKGGSN